MSDKLEKAIIELQAGNTNSLATIYELTSRGVFTFVLPIVKDYSLAEDIMQSTYVSVYENIASYQRGTSARNWILTIGKNLALNELKKRQKELSFSYDEDQPITNGLYTLDENLDTPTIRLANKVLDEDEFKIVLLYTVGEYKHREIAEMMNMPLGTITWKYKVALEKIRKALEQETKNEKERLAENN